MPRVVWAEESKNGLIFELVLVMTASQRGPNVKLMGNPAVFTTQQSGSPTTKTA